MKDKSVGEAAQPRTPAVAKESAPKSLVEQRLGLLTSSAMEVMSPADSAPVEPLDQAAVNFSTIFARENAEIKKLCQARGVPDKLPAPGNSSASKPPARFGLAFSGGGIRSAAVNMGLIQSLARVDILRHAHYISAVSGGGYTLSWLTAWTAREGFKAVDKSLKTEHVEKPGTFNERFLEPDPLHYIRRYVSYLVPRSGLASGDTLSAIAIYLRNVLLIQTMVASALIAIFALLQMLGGPNLWVGLCHPWGKLGTFVLALLTVLLGLCCWTAMDLLARDATDPLRKICALVAKVAGFALAIALWLGLPRYVAVHQGQNLFWHVACWTAGLFSLSHLLANMFVLFRTGEGEVLKGVEVHGRWAVWTLAMTGGSCLFALVAMGFASWLPSAHVTTSYIVFGLPAIFLAATLASFLYVGLLGNAFPDAKREWLGRLCGFHLFFAVVVGITLCIALWSPDWIDWVRTAGNGAWKRHALKWILPGGWVFTTISGLLAARSPKTGSQPKSPALDMLASIAPPVFLVGLMVLASWGTRHLGRQFSLQYLAGACALLTVVLAWRINVNEFSLHLFYRNRLVRTFLGASNPDRKADPFTGFALNDDQYLGTLRSDAPLTQPGDPSKAVPLSAARFNGPYPIWCTALNLTSGEDLAWQQRKAASFIYSPLYCGWDLYEPSLPGNGRAYREVAPCDPAGKGNGLGFGGRGGAPLIGTAMAASGAAISPNWGFHTKPAIAALLAVFNVRIGWWAGNPANDYFTKYAPGPYYFLAEFFGSASAADDFVYLSDGGHFENLGIYELVRRRVRYIIACDADADPLYQFGDLANAVERCRVDFGVRIDFVTPFRNIAPDPKKDGFSATHSAAAAIHYPDGTRGVLVYLKSSLTGKEPAQVLGQRAQDADFPHDSTLNQFYNESDFEAYRALGEFMGSRICEACSSPQPGVQDGESLVNYFEGLVSKPGSTTEIQPKADPAQK